VERIIGGDASAPPLFGMMKPKPICELKNWLYLERYLASCENAGRRRLRDTARHYARLRRWVGSARRRQI